MSTFINSGGDHPTALALSETHLVYSTTWFPFFGSGDSTATLRVAPLTGDGLPRDYPGAISQSDDRIPSVAWSGDRVLFLERGRSTPLFLYTLDDDGDAALVSFTSFEAAELLGANTSNAYLYLEDAPARVARVDLGTGNIETVGLVPGALQHASISGEELFFVSGPNLQEVYRFDLDQTDTEPQLMFEDDLGRCNFPIGGLTVTPTRIVCGAEDVVEFSRENGAYEGTLVDGPTGEGYRNVVVGSFGEDVYVLRAAQGPEEFPTEIRRIGHDGSETVVACDVGATTSPFSPSPYVSRSVDGRGQGKPHEYLVRVNAGGPVWFQGYSYYDGDLNSSHSLWTVAR